MWPRLTEVRDNTHTVRDVVPLHRPRVSPWASMSDSGPWLGRASTRACDTTQRSRNRRRVCCEVYDGVADLVTREPARPAANWSARRRVYAGWPMLWARPRAASRLCGADSTRRRCCCASVSRIGVVRLRPSVELGKDQLHVTRSSSLEWKGRHTLTCRDCLGNMVRNEEAVQHASTLPSRRVHYLSGLQRTSCL